MAKDKGRACGAPGTLVRSTGRAEGRQNAQHPAAMLSQQGMSGQGAVCANAGARAACNGTGGSATASDSTKSATIPLIQEASQRA